MRLLALVAGPVLVAACSGPLGTVESPHGYAGVIAWQQTGIFVGNAQTGNGISLGAVSWRAALWPMLDGAGEAIDQADILACFETGAGTGARIGDRVAAGAPARIGC